ncbi:hypothetical protein P4U97_04000 [Bacillus swezeyi]|nr:hypothetical protein [Bacillus swezeyi]
MFKELKQTVGKLSEQEAKSVLLNILLTIDMHQESEKNFISKWLIYAKT